MTRWMTRSGLLLATAALLVAPMGCDDGGGSDPEEDVLQDGVADGMDAEQDTGVEDTGVDDTGIDAGDMVGDADAGDVTPPEVVSTTPADGDMGVARDSDLVIEFNEPMDTAVGSLELSTGDVIVADDGSWNAEGTQFTYTPGTDWPPATDITVTVTTEFADVAGNALLRSVQFSFVTVDDLVPVVVESTPMEGATGLSPRNIDSIVFEWDRGRPRLGRWCRPLPGRGARVRHELHTRVGRFPGHGRDSARRYRLPR